MEEVKDKYTPRRVFYPGSGSDQKVRRLFGKDICVYNSLRDSEAYFKNNPPDIIADYRLNPFPDEIFDLVFVQTSDLPSTIQALSEFRRVLKTGFPLVLASDNYSIENQLSLAENLESMGMIDVTPSQYRNPTFRFYLFEDLVVSRQVYLAARRLGLGHEAQTRGQVLRVLEKV